MAGLHADLRRAVGERTICVMTRLPGEKPILGWALPWRFRVLIFAVVAGAVLLLGTPGWVALPMMLVMLVALNRYWLAREMRHVTGKRSGQS
jgi:hypothetical protein